MNYISNPHYRDTLFRAIFGTEEHKPWLLSLYNALNGSNHKNPDDLTLTTIEGVIYITMKNDISFLIDSQMTLIEQQSTCNPNMPLRGLFYFAELYQKYLVEQKISIYSSSLKKIPTPNYIVFYNGTKDMPDTFSLHLSEAFEKPLMEHGTFEWTAKVYNINKGRNKSLNKKCKPLYDYCRFTSFVKDNQAAGMDRNTAVKMAVDTAVEENLLDGYFKNQRAEVMGMYLHEFDRELYEKDIRDEGIAQGITQGIAQGSHNSAVETAKSLFLMNVLTLEQIASATKLSLDEVKEIQKSIGE